MYMRKTRGRGLTDFPVSPSSFTQMDALQGDHCIIMLRQETIKCKLCLLSLSKFDVLELYRACVEYVILHSWQFSCPTCGIAQGDWVRSGTYERWAVTYDYANGPVVTRMKIQRLLCRHCAGQGSCIRTPSCLTSLFLTGSIPSSSYFISLCCIIRVPAVSKISA